MPGREDPAPKPLKGTEVVDAGLDGSGELFTERLADVVCGGQVVLSETTWSAIQDQIPGQSQASIRDSLVLLHDSWAIPLDRSNSLAIQSYGALSQMFMCGISGADLLCSGHGHVWVHGA